MMPNDLTFGCEIEISRDGAGPDGCFAAIRAAGIAVERHHAPHMTRQNPAAWVVCPDGSCGGEIVSPILRGADGLAQLHRVCTALVAAGAKVDRSCGFHVHVGARNMLTIGQIQNVAKMFLRHEAAFDQILPPSRRAGTNRFCNQNARATSHSLAEKFAAIDGSRTVEAIARVMNGGFQPSQTYTHHRYYALNFQAWLRIGTLEFRQHSGTVEADKAVNWAKLIVGFVARATQIDDVRNDTTPASLDELLRKTDAAGRTFYKARAAEFAARDARRARRAA
jgi:hypothetical protein